VSLSLIILLRQLYLLIRIVETGKSKTFFSRDFFCPNSR
jgi:hypothetical protein